jgi:steroid delta-isomerase-like uncharacterized protein
MDWNAYIAAWNRHDGEAVASFFTDDGFYTDQALGQSHQGREAIKGFVKSAGDGASSDSQLTTLLDSFECGDRFTLVWTFGGTHDRSLQNPPLPASGRTFSVKGVSVGRLEGGRIKENTEYWNLLEFLTQIGAVPAPERADA